MRRQPITEIKAVIENEIYMCQLNDWCHEHFSVLFDDFDDCKCEMCLHERESEPADSSEDQPTIYIYRGIL